MANKKKINPRKVPVSKADVYEARAFGAEMMLVALIHVLKDKHDAPNDEIKQLCAAMDYFFDSVRRGYVNFKQLRDAQLEEGYRVYIKGDEE